MEVQGGVRRVYNTSVITRRMSITIPAIQVERKIKSNPDVHLLEFNYHLLFSADNFSVSTREETSVTAAPTIASIRPQSQPQI